MHNIYIINEIDNDTDKLNLLLDAVNYNSSTDYLILKGIANVYSFFRDQPTFFLKIEELSKHNKFALLADYNTIRWIDKEIIHDENITTLLNYNIVLKVFKKFKNYVIIDNNLIISTNDSFWRNTIQAFERKEKQNIRFNKVALFNKDTTRFIGKGFVPFSENILSLNNVINVDTSTYLRKEYEILNLKNMDYYRILKTNAIVKKEVTICTL